MTEWGPWEWVEPCRFGTRYLNRGALRHFLRLVFFDRQRVGHLVITLSNGWTAEMLTPAGPRAIQVSPERVE